MSPNRYLAEAVGTFILVFFGSLSILAATAMGAPILVVVPFGFGLGLLVAIAALGHVSGGHFNPAVTIAAALDRRTTPMDAAGYIVGQLAGAVAASAVVLYLAGQAAVQGTASHPGSGLTAVQAAVLETVLTAAFLLVILTVTRRAPDWAALIIALTLSAIHFAGIPFSGASVNPARSIGPAVIGGGPYDDLWVYIVGPVVGGVVGWALYRLFGSAES